MSWREQLRDASFRDVPFKIDSHDAGGIGRRTVLHEFPKRDKPQPEDMGAESATFSLEAYVVGEDYMAGRDALRAALRAPGPGRLVHPYLGELDVVIVDGSRFTESTREGGMARFSIKFVEWSDATYPDLGASTPQAVSAACDVAATAAQAAFADAFLIPGHPAFVSDAAKAMIDDAISQMQEASRAISMLPEGAAELGKLVTDVSATVGTLILAPADLAQNIFTLMSQVRTGAARPGAAIDALRELFTFGDDAPAVAVTTPTRQRQADNQAALTQLTQQLATFEAARAGSAVTFDSVDDAFAFRDELVEQFDKVAERVEDYALYAALVAARTAALDDLKARSVDLARVMTLTLPETVPALALAYSLYGDAEREAEIVARNQVASPLFVPAGVPLSLVAHAE